MIRFKPDVRIHELTDQLVAIVRACAAWSGRSSVAVEFNSIDDGAGVHGADTLHGFSLAVDVDTVGDKPEDLDQLDRFLRRRLPIEFDVVFEGDHVHVEWDTHRPARRPGRST